MYLKVENNKIVRLSEVSFEGFTHEINTQQENTILTNFHIIDNKICYRELECEGENIINFSDLSIDI